MDQITQKLKTGDIAVKNVPVPIIGSRKILVKNHYSLVSAGTESSTVKTARKGYIGKAKDRPEQVRQVLQTLKTQGPVQTYRAVMKKLVSYSPLGYSCTGQVIGVASDVSGFSTGDRVACAGLTASHAEIICVPVNLCVKIPADADLKLAAYNTLGAIALQGVRQADMRLGETCAVIGLGLLGQLSCMLLKAAGVRAIGIDVDSAMVEIASQHCCDLALNRSEPGLEERISRISDGLGCDAVIITAASTSLDPINLAGVLCRKRGTVVVVGDVPTGFSREPHYYKKELQVKMSCSYGPGRYDPGYEEKGIDYPPGYVRWTEKRNMQAFQALIYENKIDPGYLTTHIFKLENAPDAYDLMMEKAERFIGILIEYDTTKKIENKAIFNSTFKSQGSEPSEVNIGFIGAGSYAQSNLLPNISKQPSVCLKGVLTLSGTSSRTVAERFGFEFCTGDRQELLCHEEINTIFIATRHDSHAELVTEALKHGKNVFVEKPLCLTEQELIEIFEIIAPSSDVKWPDNQPTDETILTNQTNSTNQPLLMVGFNRRFAPLTQKLKQAIPSGPMAMAYRINAGKIPADSWIQDPAIGGGRIIGEVCHFVDYLTYLNGSLPKSVHATAMADPQHLNDIVNISLTYGNGSIGTISYLSNGAKTLPKERVEVFANGCSAVIEDFKSLTIYSDSRKTGNKLINQDKGQKQQVEAFVKAVLNGSTAPISSVEIYSATLATFKIIESIRTGECVRIT